VLLVLYGLRRGEVFGLRWADIDSDARVIHVRQQLQRVRGELRLVR
jgi:integrase